MNINEVMELEQFNYSEVEIYKKEVDNLNAIRMHGDFIKEVENYTGLEEVGHWTVMDEDDYNNSILVNSCINFSDIFKKNDKILVILLKK